jgi:UDP-glucose 6-dehydrogenase
MTVAVLGTAFKPDTDDTRNSLPGACFSLTGEAAIVRLYTEPQNRLNGVTAFKP